MRFAFLAGGALRAGVECFLDDVRVFGQAHDRFDMIDLEVPAIARHVPVKLVIVREKSDLPVGDVGNDEEVLAIIEFCVGAADLDALAVVKPVDLVILVVAVHRHTLHVEAHAHSAAELVGVKGGEVAIDAVVDAVALHIDRDGLDDVQRSVFLNGDVAGEIQNAFRPFLRRDRGGEGKREERRSESGPAHQEKETFGTARSAALSISKNCAGVKLPMPATKFDGNC